MAGTKSKSSPGGIFDAIGGVLGDVAETGVKTFSEVAPIWAKQELIDQKESDTVRPTFQETLDTRLKNIETTVKKNQQSTGSARQEPERRPDNVFAFDMNQLLLFGGAIFLGFVMLNNEG